MPTTILIGKNRRLTIEELYVLAVQRDGLLEIQASHATSGEGLAPDEGSAGGEKSGSSATHGLDHPQREVAEVDRLAACMSVMSLNKHVDHTSDGPNESTPAGAMSQEESVACLTILANMVAQERLLETSSANKAMTTTTSQDASSAALVESLVALVNVLGGGSGSSCSSSNKSETQVAACPVALTLPSDPILLQNILKQILLASSTTAAAAIQQCSPTAVLQRARDLAIVTLALYEAIHVAAAALPIAALTVDTWGCACAVTMVGSDTVSVMPYYTEQAMDLLRPHRSMIQAAAVLRAVLNDSRFAGRDSMPLVRNSSTWVALRDVPQYHGPAVDDVRGAYKRTELELNGHAMQNDIVLDTTVLDLCQQQTISAIQILIRQSQVRMMENDAQNGTQELSIDNSHILSVCVRQLQAILQQEIDRAINIIQQETTRAVDQAKAKEVGKQQASETAAGSKPSDDDEFAGMTEAQKAKILKRRAEKDAKAAAKKKSKEEKGVSLFGAGTVQLVSLLQTASSSRALYDMNLLLQLEQILEKFLSGGVQRKPKIPKGTRDYLPEQMMIRQQAFAIIRRVFQAHGAVEIDTPVFELKETLTGKYGEDSKLIYDLADQGGELLALRYDLTVPFARFLALNSVGNIKRFHIGKVYRRDQPALKRGRYREFYQCDFDIAGQYGRMIPDSECLCVVCEILDGLPIGDFGIKLNHRRLLDAILDVCGVPKEKFRTICSAVDKLDKEPWEEVKREMTEDKGLAADVADKVGSFVLRKGDPWTMFKELTDSKLFGDHAGALAALEDLRILFDYLEAMDKLKFMTFDLSLARGLDYYTGVIYEAVCMSGNTQVGSIGGGGRYDYLVGMFQESGKETPCVGVSVGIERVFTLMEAKLREEQGGVIKPPAVQVWVASAGSSMMKEKMKIAKQLWDAKISAEYSQQEQGKLKKELTSVLDRDIPFMVIVGEEELVQNKVKVKDLRAKTEELVEIGQLVRFLRREKKVVPVGCEFAAEMLDETSNEVAVEGSFELPSIES